MKSIKKKGQDGLVHFDVTATTADVSDVLNKAGIQFCNQMGIRPAKGMTAAQAASEQMGIKDLDSMISQQAIEMLIPMAISKHNVIPAFTPQVKAKSMLRRGKTFQFEMDVMPKPTYELKSYEPVSITIEPYEEDEEAIDREIGRLAEAYTGYVKDDPRPIGEGDDCLLRIEARKDGEPVSGLSTPGRTYSVGSGYMPEGFDQNVRGMEVGDVRTFTFEGPGLDEDMNEIMEEFEVTVELLEVQKKAVPVINDEWVSKYMPMYKGYQELRADIGKSVNAQRLRAYEDYKRNYAASELAKRFEGSIPDEIYEGARTDIMRQIRQQLQSSGMTWEQFVEQQGGEQNISMMIMLETRQQLIQGFSLDAYYRHEKLSFTEEDIDDVCTALNPSNPKMVRQQMEASGMGYVLRESAERLAAAKHLVACSDIKVKGDE